ncbi:MAG: hypothetical protein ABIR80_08915, partial [Opitutaceae bacterium]
MKFLLLIACSLCPLAVAATRIETVRNGKVIAYEETLRPGETEAAIAGAERQRAIINAANAQL